MENQEEPDVELMPAFYGKLTHPNFEKVGYRYCYNVNNTDFQNVYSI